MSTLQDLIKQKEALEAKIEQVRRDERSGAIIQAKALIDEYGLSVADVFGEKRGGPKAPRGPKAIKSPIAPKYRDPATGATWSGRGLSPKWMRGRDKAAFLIKP